MMSRFFPVAAIAALVTWECAQAGPLPEDHPSGELVKTYLTAVVHQDWEKAGSMLSEVSLQKKLAETVGIISSAQTMTEEAAMLGRLGLKDLDELQQMSPRAFYAVERAAVHQRINVEPEVLQKKKDTLKINIIGLLGEDGDRVVHAVVRTSQETMRERIHELFLISMERDPADEKRWVVVPDMTRPVAEKLGESAGAEAAAK
jgi:hypothetical protein